MSLFPGYILQNKYRIERLIGEGGFGYVYEATDLLLHRRVAIKSLKPEISRDTEAFQRFVREAEAASVINHPNVITVYGVERVNDGYYIVMEYMDGGSLGDRLRASGVLPPDEATRITLALLDALAAVHQHGIIHRDIKPSNILFTANGQVKLGDFGIARAPTQGTYSLTQSGAVLGTVQYMSPEQARGERVDARSDLYALGAVLYEMLAGHSYLPFGDNLLQNLEFVKSRLPLPLPPNVPKPLASVVYRALAKPREARYQSASEMSVALRASQVAATVRGLSVPSASPQMPTLPIALAVLMVGVIAILVITFSLLLIRVQANAAIATQNAQTAIALAATPTLTVTPSRTPTILTPLPTPTYAPFIVVTPTPTPTPALEPPPRGEVWYDFAGTGIGISRLTEWFKLVEKNDPDYVSKYTDFYNAHPEIHFSLYPNNPNYIAGTLKVKYDELAVMGLADPNLRTLGPKWLVLKADANNTANGLEALEKYINRWVLVRVRWENERFRIDPSNFIFVYDPGKGRYEQPLITLTVTPTPLPLFIPTETPTYTPTSTATPTRFFPEVLVLRPRDKSRFAQNEAIILQWQAADYLRPLDEYYVQVSRNYEIEKELVCIIRTRETQVRLPGAECVI